MAPELGFGVGLGFEHEPGGLYSLSSALINFTPSEHLLQPYFDDIPTSTLLRDIHSWTMAFRASTSAAAFARGPYRALSEARFVLSSSLSESAGLPDLETTVQALQSGDSPTSSAQRESTQFGHAVRCAQAYAQELDQEQQQSTYYGCVLTPQVVEYWHFTFMKGLLPNAGTVRTGYAYAEMPGKRRHYYADPELIPGLMLATFDLHNASLHVLAQEYPCGELSVDTIRLLYNVAALLFVHVVSVHPFSDGNGRIGRLLAAFVLSVVTPFLVTPYADGFSITRHHFLECIKAARIEVGCKRFMNLRPPCEFAALLVQAGWQSWRCFIEEYREHCVLLADVKLITLADHTGLVSPKQGAAALCHMLKPVETVKAKPETIGVLCDENGDGMTKLRLHFLERSLGTCTLRQSELNVHG